MAKKVKVKSFTRKGGVRVKGFTRILSNETLEKLRKRAKEILLPAGIKWVGKVGFREAVAKLKGHPEIKNPEKLAGFLKGQAKKRGVLSPKHPYKGRKGYRKYPDLWEKSGHNMKVYRRLVAQRRRKKKK